jgi:uncharacterized protein (TIGR02145 family)
MKSSYGWENNGIGTNSSGFSGFPCGYRSAFGPFNGFGNYCNWWSSNEYSNYNHMALNRLLIFNNGKLNSGELNKAFGLSVRCLKD